MSKATMSVEGYLSRDGELRYTQSGRAVLGLSIPHTPRRKNQQSGQWEDAGETLWVAASLWEDAAEAFAEFAVKGALVRVEGEPTMRAWESNGRSGVNLELTRVTASVIPRPVRNAPPRGQEAPPAAPNTDAAGWYTPGPANQQPSFQDEWAPSGAYGDDTPF